MKKERILAESYVVVLHDTSTENCWANYCFKQGKTSFSIIPESTPRYPINTHSDGTHDESFCVDPVQWRYATDDEISRYEREGLFKITSSPKTVVQSTNYSIW